MRKGLLRLFAMLPLPLAHALGAGVGLLLWLLPNRHRRITRRNIDLCFPDWSDAERRRLARRSLVESGKTLLESGAIWLWSGPRTLGLIREVSGETHVKTALAEGRGVIAISPHLGNWELCGLYLSARYGITSLFRPPAHRGDGRDHPHRPGADGGDAGSHRLPRRAHPLPAAR